MAEWCIIIELGGNEVGIIIPPPAPGGTPPCMGTPADTDDVGTDDVDTDDVGMMEGT